MAKTGRPRKPTAVRALEGNRGNRPLPQNEPKPDAGLPPKPADLPARASAEWDRLAPMLVQQGLLCVEDLADFTAYCLAWDTMMSAQAQLQSPDDMVNETGHGTSISAWLRIRNQAMGELRRLGHEFGLSPSARAGVQANPKQPKQSRVSRLRAVNG